jgi:lysophospholipase
MTEPAVGYLEGTGGVRVFYRAWEVADPAGCVLFVHGLGEHGGRYDRLAEVVGTLDLDLYAIDLRGHGRSQGRRGHVSDFACFLRDLDRLRRRAGRETAGRATFLVGHSLGGLVVGRYAEAFAPDGLRGVVFVSPFVETEMSIPGWKRSLGAAADRMVPALTMDNGLTVEDLFRRESDQRVYEEDPLVHHRISARLWGEIQRASPRLLSDAHRLRVQVLLQLAGSDTVVSNPAARDFGARLASRPEVIEYEGAFHALYFDPRAEEALADLRGWLEQRMTDGTMD